MADLHMRMVAFCKHEGHTKKDCPMPSKRMPDMMMPGPKLKERMTMMTKRKR